MRQPSKEDAARALEALEFWPATHATGARAIVRDFIERAARRLPTRAAYDRARIKRKR